MMTFFLLFVFSCETEKSPRIYKEILIRTSISNVETSKITYILPVTWQIMPFLSSKSSFVAPAICSFRIVKDGQIIMGTVSEIKGDGGSVQSNVERWMRQLNMIPMNSKNLNNWLKKQVNFKTKNNFKGVIIDLTTLLSGNLKQKEYIVASIIETPFSKIFVKIKGDKDALIENRSQILDFSKSIQRQEND